MSDARDGPDAAPRSVKCFEGKPGEYGRDLISTGRYMIKGSDQVDISSARR